MQWSRPGRHSPQMAPMLGCVFPHRAAGTNCGPGQCGGEAGSGTAPSRNSDQVQPTYCHLTIPLLAERVPRFYERTRDGKLSRISKVRPLASEAGHAVYTIYIVGVGGGRPEAYLVEQRCGQVLPACQESQPRPPSPPPATLLLAAPTLLMTPVPTNCPLGLGQN